MRQKTELVIQNSQQEVAAELAAMELEQAVTYCYDQVAAGLGKSVEENFRLFFLALWFLEHAGRMPSTTAKAVRTVTNASEALLKACNVRATAGKYSYLHGRIYRALSQFSATSGEQWLASWQGKLAQMLAGAGTSEDAVDELIAVASKNLHVGHVVDAARTYWSVEQQAEEAAQQAQACLGRIRCMRLLGSTAEAHCLAEAAVEGYSSVPELAVEFAWQERLCRFQINGEVEQLTVAWDRSSNFFQPEYSLTAALIMHAARAVRPLAIRRSATIKRNDFPDTITLHRPEYRLFKMLGAIEALMDASAPLTHRLATLGRFISTVRWEAPADQQLLFLAAASRSLHRLGQTQFVLLLVSEYVGLSLRLSEGQKRDVLNLIPDLSGHGPAIQTLRQKNDSELLEAANSQIPGVMVTKASA